MELPELACESAETLWGQRVSRKHFKYEGKTELVAFLRKRRPTEKDGGVLSLLASVKGCLTYFQNGARNLSFNYKHHKDEDKRPGDDDYTFEKCN